ncbi:MerR family transcriptional regulator [Murimonas intestini]|uniref:MerR family transcriptional regulator n=1 Tax=Murimonas intestini TaxID=1337051 RepID=UPI0011DCA052|nr:MerR family transcriptional regulator [Murimonas intestini]
MQKFNTPCIKTGEFASLCGTNKRTLFHYDEIGLFSPAWTDEKGYRYYSESQCDVFFTITCLREIGMPLKEIKEYIDCRSPAALKTLLLEQQERIRQELDRLKRIQQVIQTKIELVDLSETPKCKDSASISLEEMPEEYLIISPRIDTNDHDIIIRTICEHIGYCRQHSLNSGHPYGAMLTTHSLMEGHLDTYAHFFTKVNSAPEGHPCCKKPAGLYAVTYLRGNYYDAADAYEQLFSYIRRKNLTPGMFSYKEAVLDEIAVSDENEYLTKISIEISG